MDCKSFTCMLLALSATFYRKQQGHQAIVSEHRWPEEVDFIIIGGGTAGCVLATRLSEVSHFHVLVLEVGGPQPVISERADFNFLPDISWAYQSVPQKHTAGAFKNRTIPIHKGRVLGGGSVINGRIYNRGSKHDFDDWRDRLGLTGWGYDDIKKYFVKSERNLDSVMVQSNDGFHGTDGVWSISSTEPNDVHKTIIEAVTKSGYPLVDINGADYYGVTSPQTIVRDNLRQSVATAFLEPAAGRPNLNVVVHARVTKILFDDKKRAVAVEFDKNGQRHMVRCRKEVILSAGAIKSPQILMLSGVGPKDHLAEFGIELIADLPVGHNFHDHVFSRVNFDIVDQHLITSKRYDMNIENLYQLFVQNKGPLGERGYFLANINTKHINRSDWPDANFIGQLMISKNLETYHYYEDSHLWREYLVPYRDRWYVGINVQVNRPKSKGTIRLQSTSPFVDPLIDPNFLAEEYDVDVLVDALRIVYKMSESFSMCRPYKHVPGCDPCPDDNDFTCEEYLRCHVRQAYGLTAYHVVGSCKMGSDDDLTAVVDRHLKVKHVTGLRVVDGSVIPEVTSGNTMTPIVMIAEKAADMIKEEHGTTKENNINHNNNNDKISEDRNSQDNVNYDTSSGISDGSADGSLSDNLSENLNENSNDNVSDNLNDNVNVGDNLNEHTSVDENAGDNANEGVIDNVGGSDDETER